MFDAYCIPMTPGRCNRTAPAIELNRDGGLIYCPDCKGEFPEDHFYKSRGKVLKPCKLALKIKRLKAVKENGRVLK